MTEIRGKMLEIVAKWSEIKRERKRYGNLCVDKEKRYKWQGFRGKWQGYAYKEEARIIKSGKDFERYCRRK